MLAPGDKAVHTNVADAARLGQLGTDTFNQQTAAAKRAAVGKGAVKFGPPAGGLAVLEEVLRRSIGTPRPTQ